MPWGCLNCLRPQSADIKQLNYQHCTLHDVPAEVFAFERTLEELYLDSNRIRDLPRPLFHCHGLKVLSLSDNEVHSLPPAVASLINLSHLDVSRNALNSIPDNLKGCKHLTYVDVSVNPLEKLPEGFTQLISLEELYLNDTYLDFLPANFGRLLKLRILELRENNLNTLPKSIARLTHLQRLDIGQNDFSDLPEVIGSLVNLTELWIDSNRIRCIPTFIGNLKLLVHLEASNNNISWIASEIEHCTRLIDLTVSCNELREIPETIGHLKQLVTLKLDDNQISHLPNTIGELSKLEELILSQNDLESINPCIGLLRKLHVLNVDDNMLEDLPSEIGSCSSLTILSAHSNKLQWVPAELGHLSNLRVINLSENQLQSLPVSVLNLVNLTALWLSNNQSTPLTTLQQEVDKETGQTVCVNFMLPQSTQETCFQDTQQKRHDIERGDQPTKAKQHITFATDADLEAPSRLMRAPTPYPKELRAMAKHARAIHHPRKSSRESDEDTPLLGEMVSQEPKDLLIKEAKVKKPTTSSTGEQFMKGMSSEKCMNIDDKDSEMKSCVEVERTVSRYDHYMHPIHNHGDEGSPVIASDSGPIVREAKCVRKLPSPVTMKERQSISSNYEQYFPQPPPYHIAAAYSKQALYFRQVESQNQKSNSIKCLNDEKPEVGTYGKREGFDSTLTSRSENFNNTAAQKSDNTYFYRAEEKQFPCVLEHENGMCGGYVREGNRSGMSSTPILSKLDYRKNPFNFNDDQSSRTSSPAREVSKITLDELQSIDGDESTLQFHLSLSSREVPLDKSPAASGDEHRLPFGTSFSPCDILDKSHAADGDVRRRQFNASLGSCDILNEAGDDGDDHRRRFGTSFDSRDISLDESHATDDGDDGRLRFDMSTSSHNIAYNLSETHNSEIQSASEINVEQSVQNCKEDQENLHHNCDNQLPVALLQNNNGTQIQESEELLMQKPQTFTQDKPIVSEGVIAPTPHRPGSPGTPNSPLIDSIGFFAAKSGTSPSQQNNLQYRKPSGIPKSISKPVSRTDSGSSDGVSNKLNDSLDQKPNQMYWQSPLSSRIPQPAFYANSPPSVVSSRRSSISSSATRPGSIASSCEVPCSITDKPKMLPSLEVYSNTHQNHFGIIKENISNEDNCVKDVTYISSRIPTHSELSPTRGSRPPPSAQSRIPAPMKFSSSVQNTNVKTHLDLTGKHIKTWMFGPHRNATVFPVTIQKNPGLGFSISGGAKSATNDKYEFEIFVTKVHPGGPASGVLLPGDKILEVDGMDFTKLDHDQAVRVLRQTSNVVNMMISRQQT